MSKPRKVIARHRKNLSLTTKKRKRKPNQAADGRLDECRPGKKKAQGGKGARNQAVAVRHLPAPRDVLYARTGKASDGSTEARKILAMPALACPDFLKGGATTVMQTKGHHKGSAWQSLEDP